MLKFVKFGLAVLGLVLTFGAPDKIFARALQQTNACTTANTGADPSATVCVSRNIIVFDGLYADNRFYVSWVSAQAESGQVQLIGGATYSDTCGECYNGVTHYIRVDNLQPNTTYPFDIASGGNTYTDNGAHWSINTGSAQPTGTPTSPYVVTGRVKNPNGSDAVGALVYVFIRDVDGSGTPGRSALLSQVITTDDASFFHIDLNQARTSDFANFFNYSPSGDRLIIRVVGAAGTASTTAEPDSIHPPVQQNLTLVLTSSGGTVVTATPSVAPLTPTPTVPSPTPTLTLTQSSTPLTATAARTNPPPTATSRAARPPVIEPTEMAEPSPGITIAPAEGTSAAETTAVAEATTANIEQNPETETTRVAFRGTPTPDAGSSIGGIFAGNSLGVLAIIAFVGAALLGVTALFIWRK